MGDGDKLHEPQIVSYTETSKCDVCDASLVTMTAEGRQAHFDAHLEDEVLDRSQVRPPDAHGAIDLCDDDDDGENFESQGQSTQPRRQEKRKNNTFRRKKDDSEDRWHGFWHLSQRTTPPHNFTPGIIPLLRKALLKSHEKGQTVRAALCYSGVVHVSAQWDFTWSCGYRNFLMACTALVEQQIQPSYAAALDHPTMRKLQEWIEEAWKAGIDEDGANDLKHKLVGTNKWIGTAELHVAFQTRGIPSKLVDFPRVDPGAEIITHWIERYFTSYYDTPQPTLSQPTSKTTIDEALRGASPVVLTDRMPIILQHHGHSRTIVGYERIKNGSVNLLCFDPPKTIKETIRKAALAFVQPLAAQTPSHGGSPPAGSKRKNIFSTKFMDRLLHPEKGRIEGADYDCSPTSRKRSLVKPSTDELKGKLKRVRGGLHVAENKDNMGGDDHREIIDIDSDGPEEDDDDMHVVVDATSPKHGSNMLTDGSVDIDYAKALEIFRLKPNVVGKQDKYQILYFPMDDLLTEEERWSRRVVTSDTILMQP